MDDPFLTRSYLTMEIVREVLAEFEWPAPYELEDDLPDGILVAFPRCRLTISDDYLGDVHLHFSTEDTGTKDMLSLGHAMAAFVPRPEHGAPASTPGLSHDMSIRGSVEKVRNNLRDLCTILLTHLRPVLLGNFAWAQRHRERERGEQEH
jgi:hypothetical protein